MTKQNKILIFIIAVIIIAAIMLYLYWYLPKQKQAENSANEQKPKFVIPDDVIIYSAASGDKYTGQAPNNISGTAQNIAYVGAYNKYLRN